MSCDAAVNKPSNSNPAKQNVAISSFTSKLTTPPPPLSTPCITDKEPGGGWRTHGHWCDVPSTHSVPTISVSIYPDTLCLTPPHHPLLLVQVTTNANYATIHTYDCTTLISFLKFSYTWLVKLVHLYVNQVWEPCRQTLNLPKNIFFQVSIRWTSFFYASNIQLWKLKKSRNIIVRTF